jgi:hypothetical protein
MNHDLKEPGLRAVRYWYVDGTFELAFGGLCLLLAVYFYAQAALADSWMAGLLSGLLVLVLIGGGYLVNRLTRALKERLTYPRTGFVSYQRERGMRRGLRIAVAFAGSALIAGLLVLFVAGRPNGFEFMPGVTGLVFGAVIAFIGHRTALPRFYLLAALSLVFGAGLSVSGLSEGLDLAAFYGALSLVLFTFGGVTLWRYLRHNPGPAEAPDEH